MCTRGGCTGVAWARVVHPVHPGYTTHHPHLAQRRVYIPGSDDEREEQLCQRPACLSLGKSLFRNNPAQSRHRSSRVLRGSEGGVKDDSG